MGAEDYEITGWRFIYDWDGAAPFVGQELPVSYRWDGDEKTDEELPGTCAWETRDMCEHYSKHSRGTGWIAKVGGNRGGWGEEPGEIIIRAAVVLAVEVW